MTRSPYAPLLLVSVLGAILTAGIAYAATHRYTTLSEPAAVGTATGLASTASAAQ